MEGDLETDSLEPDGSDTPAYILIGSASIPVSKKAGQRWKDKIDSALQAYDTIRSLWELAYREFRRTGDMGHTFDNGDRPDNYFQNNTDENLTRENVKTMLRTTYTRNPSIELSTIDNTDDDMLDTLEAVINQLLQRTHAPGLNAKARVRRWLMHAHLTNMGVLKLDFQGKEGSRAAAQENLLKTQEKLANAKDINEIEELYANLEQIEDELPSTREPGMLLKNVAAGSLIIDPDCTTADLSTANWTDEVVWLGDKYIQQRFLEKDDNDVWVRKTDGRKPGAGFDSNYETNQDDIRSKVADEILGVTPESVVNAQHKGKTKCHIIWDKLTKQISLWIDGAWDYPLWVYQDDLKLSRFYPYFIHAFTEPLESIVQEGESAQYYGQTQEVNKINKRVAFVRMLAFGQLIFNTRKLEATQVAKIVAHMKNPKEFDALGLDWDPETKLADMFDLFVPPDGKIQELYDKSDLMKTIDRVNSVSAVQRGEQFKTNTTNKAVAAYGQAQASVANELTDSVEDSMADLTHAMCEIIVSKYTKEQVTALVGQKLAEAFKPMTVQEFNATYSVTIASGSTEKPTSENKKQEALAVAQAVGQVGQATPMTSLKIMFRMFKEAFSSFAFTKDDEDMLNTEATAALQKGVSTPQQPGQSPPAPQQPPVGAPNGGKVGQ